MKRLIGMMLLGSGAGAAVVRWLLPRREENARLAVTVNRPPDEVAPEGRLPEPLQRIGNRADVRIRPAPGDRGTEIEALLAQPVPTGARAAVARLAGEDPRGPVRSALRQAKSLLETGEVLRADVPSTDRPTPAGKVLDLLTRRSAEEGRL